MTDSLIPPPLTETPEDMAGKNDSEELLETAERRLQWEEESYEQYQTLYMGQLSEEEESDTELDDSTYCYFA